MREPPSTTTNKHTYVFAPPDPSAGFVLNLSFFSNVSPSYRETT